MSREQELEVSLLWLWMGCTDQEKPQSHCLNRTGDHELKENDGATYELWWKNQPHVL